MFNSSETEQQVEKALVKQRIKTVIIGSIVAIILGLVVVNTYTYFQYGGTMFDRFFEGKEQETNSPDAGKFAYGKSTGDYMGIIRGEKKSPGRGQLYLIEQPGGQLMEISKERIEVREK
jgi:hypothetical protein